ncbi:MAG: universal stress protein [Gammaproteobacteria bacterium]|nr:universal stress protein [Gammaproteobacteria bacterium]
MYKRILIPLDGSPLSEQVLPYALHIAETFNAEVALVCAVAMDDAPDSAVSQICSEREQYLRDIADTIAGGLTVRCVAEPGHPASVIIEKAEEQEDTLITMATHGYSGLQRWLLGSVAHKVVQASDAPVLLLPAGAEGPDGGPVQFKRVIIPLDGSVLAELILPHVATLCSAFDMEMILVRAYVTKFPGATVRMHEVDEIVREAAESYIKEKAEELQGTCQSKVSYELLHGIPAEQITDFALATQNSLTAMSTHGRTGVGRWVLGSVTDAVIHSSHEPVLVVRTPHTADD